MKRTFDHHAIGIIGAGTIVRHAHVPAYRGMGLNIRAVYDVDAARASQLVAEIPGARVASSLDELLRDPQITVVDIGITPQDQPAIARRALDAGKHLLCQKPLASTLTEAQDLVAFAAAKRRKLAVNQQMRWEPIVAQMKRSLDDHSIGAPTAALIQTNLKADFPAEHWLSKETRFMALYGCIHFLDSARFLFGEPQWVTARLSRDPQQVARGETWINAWLEWSNGLMLVIFERYTNWAGDQTALMRLEGTKGTIRGRIGIWDCYPSPSPDRVERLIYGQDRWEDLSDGRCWLPDAFPGPMTGLLDAIDQDHEPPTSGRDNLLTLRLVEALYLSSRERRAVRPEDCGLLKAGFDPTGDGR